MTVPMHQVPNIFKTIPMLHQTLTPHLEARPNIEQELADEGEKEDQEEEEEEEEEEDEEEEGGEEEKKARGDAKCLSIEDLSKKIPQLPGPTTPSKKALRAQEMFLIHGRGELTSTEAIALYRMFDAEHAVQSDGFMFDADTKANYQGFLM